MRDKAKYKEENGSYEENIGVDDEEEEEEEDDDIGLKTVAHDSKGAPLKIETTNDKNFLSAMLSEESGILSISPRNNSTKDEEEDDDGTIYIYIYIYIFVYLNIKLKTNYIFIFIISN